MDPSHQFTAALGYFELGMLEDAEAALKELPEDEIRHPRTLRFRSQLLIARGAYDEALATCRQLLDVDPDDPSGYIHGAYCLHELERTQEAREMLLTGPDNLRDEPIFFYNLGCYEARLGEIESARAWLLRSFQMDRDLKLHARRDPDLEEIWDDLEDSLLD